MTRSILAVSAAAQVLLLASAAQAQSNVEIEEVVVTAERREETAQRTPLAITALSADQLTKQGVRTVTDLTNIVPGVQIGATGGSVEIAVRGIGSTI